MLGAIDDATGKVVFAHFRPTEDQVGYLLLLRTVAETHGLPMALCHDRRTILRSPKQPSLEDELAGRSPISQVQRVTADLGIESIAACHFLRGVLWDHQSGEALGSLLRASEAQAIGLLPVGGRPVAALRDHLGCDRAADLELLQVVFRKSRLRPVKVSVRDGRSRDHQTCTSRRNVV